MRPEPVSENPKTHLAGGDDNVQRAVSPPNHLVQPIETSRFSAARPWLSGRPFPVALSWPYWIPGVAPALARNHDEPTMTDTTDFDAVPHSRVLLVDDEPAVPEGIVRALMDEPYTFFTATSGAEALEILGKETIDIIVSDDQMPGMSGIELLTRVRFEYPQVIRIVLTGQASVRSAMKAIHDGWIYQYLHKPCHPADLAAIFYTAMLLRSLPPPPDGSHQCTEVDYRDRLLRSVTKADVSRLGTSEPPTYSAPPWKLD
jgi:CheY-like chemotaxis protein